jgi:hypothetical protein
MAISIDFRQIILISKNISQYFVDIGRFIFQPREYFKIVLQEKPIHTLKRLILYSVGFDFVVFSLFYAVTESPNLQDPFKFSIKLFGIAILEILVGLILVPPFFLTGQFCKPRIGLRISIIYSLTFKFVYFLIPVIFYIFFILTENYVFAFLKGGIYFLFLIMLFLFFPFLFSVGFKRRILTVVISFFSCLLTLFVFGYALSYFPNSFEKLIKLAINYDPIGSEVNNTVWKIYKHPYIKFEEFSRFNNIVMNTISRGKKTKQGSILISLASIESGIETFEIEWNQKGQTYKEELENQLREIGSDLNSVKYSTTKEFLNLKQEELRSGLILISKLDELLKILKSNPSKFIDLLPNNIKLETEYLRKYTIFVTKMNDYWRFLFLFRKYCIIIY